MKSNVPWSIKGIDPDAREAAKKAARQAGMTLGEWLNEQIMTASDEEPTGGPAFQASPVTIEHLRELVASLNRLNERLQSTEKRSEHAITGLNRGLNSALERINAMEARGPGEDNDALLERIERIESGSVDATVSRGSIDGLKALEQALERTLTQFENVSEETQSRLSANEERIDGLATRVDHMDAQFNEALRALRANIDDINDQIADTENTAQSVLAEARAAAASSDEEFIQRTSNKLRILGNEIKRTSDRIQSLDDKMMRLSGKIEASEQRSAEGIGQISRTITALSQELVEFDRDQSASVKQARAVIEQASGEADDRLTTLKSSFESMLSRIEGAAEGKGESMGGDTAGLDTARRARMDDAPEAGEDEDGDAMGPLPDDLDFDLPEPGARETARAETAELLAGDAPSEEDFDAVFGEQLAPPRDQWAEEEGESDARGTHRQGTRRPERQAPAPRREAASRRQGPVARDHAGLREADDDSEDERSPVAPEAKMRPEDRLTPKQKVILAARARRRRLEAQARQEGTREERLPHHRALHEDDEGYPTSRKTGRDGASRNEGRAPRMPAAADLLHEDENEAYRAPREAAQDETVRADRQYRADRGSSRRPRDEDERPEAEEREDETPRGEESGDGLLSSLAGRLKPRRGEKRGQEQGRDGQHDDYAEIPARASENEIDRLRRKYAQRPERERSLPVVPMAVIAILVVAILGYILLKDTLMGGISSMQPPEQAGPVAVETVDPDALYARGVALVQAGETEAQMRRGIDMVRRAARAGYPPAEYRLGEYLRLGQGMPADAMAARRWYTQAAEGGNVPAMHRLGSLYAAGEGGERNDFSALAWFEEAAQYGYLDSIYNLGLLYDPTVELEIADEIRDDGERAYFWYALAARLGDPDAGMDAEAVGETLPATRRDAIDAEVAAWQAEPLIADANLNG